MKTFLLFFIVVILISILFRIEKIEKQVNLNGEVVCVFTKFLKQEGYLK